ncbi:MAG: type II secretion system protein [Thermoguttaceae bacterium]
MNGNRRPAGDSPIPTATRARVPGRWAWADSPSLIPNPQSLIPRARPGFTLVELLVVITIIAVLTGLITAAAIMARKTAMSARMKIETSQMDQALNAFKEQFGADPPDGTNLAALQQFLANAFPRQTAVNPSNISLPWTPPGCSVALSPSTALSIWLGGLQYTSGNAPTGYSANQPAGFSNNPLNPFDNNASRTGPFFNFDTSRLTNGTAGTTGYVYFPNNGLSANSGASSTAPNSPYYYYCAQNGTYTTTGSGPQPYMFNASAPGFANLGGTYVNPNSFQILCPGLDGVYGTSNLYPPTFGGSSPASASQLDDITNFIKGATMKADMPD